VYMLANKTGTFFELPTSGGPTNRGPTSFVDTSAFVRH
jgi:hypothetical protein